MTTAIAPEPGVQTITITVAAKPATHIINLALVPETPAELLREGKASGRPAWPSAVVGLCSHAWDAVLGPPMTERERQRRTLASSRAVNHHMLTY